MNKAAHPVLTIGHSNHSMKTFTALLCQQAIAQVVDVRSSPFSRFNPQFNRDVLGPALEQYQIRYLFLGHKLGGRSTDPSCYVDGRVQYARVAKTNLFNEGIKRVIQEAEGDRIAIMCAEKEPLHCHRTLLVAGALDERGMAVEHILADGQTESQHEVMNRLLDATYQKREDLFMTREELLAEAIKQQEKQVAYQIAEETP